MKYIRTKEGIYEYLNNFRITKTGLWEVATDCGNEGFFGKFKGEVVDQADTIEELCDEFRGIWINYYESEKKDAHEEYHYDKERDIFYDDFEELTREEAIEKFDIFYGAIWTDKGLIYVTRLDGEKCVERGFKLL